MAATEGAAVQRWASVVSAALALPGLAGAQALPEQGPSAVSVRWMSYRDWQPGLDRIRVTSPAVNARWSHADGWSLDASVVGDHVSGASPRYHTAVSGASRMSDRRTATQLRWTRYEAQRVAAYGLATSDENDYHSRALSAQWSWGSDDRNRSWSVGVNASHDRIGSADAPRFRAQRNATELVLAYTAALTPSDLVQGVLAWGQSRGYHSDPYKTPDLRPSQRRWGSLTLRWHHHFDTTDWSLRTSYRAYSDSFGVASHTLSLEGTWSSPGGWRWSPLLRLYSQDAASFYYNPVYEYQGIPVPPGGFQGQPNWISADQRLSAFGSVALGVRLQVPLDAQTTLDARLERYEQRTAWHLLTPGSRGLAPLSAAIVQVGLERRF